MDQSGRQVSHRQNMRMVSNFYKPVQRQRDAVPRHAECEYIRDRGIYKRKILREKVK